MTVLEDTAKHIETLIRHSSPLERSTTLHVDSQVFDRECLIWVPPST